MLHHALISAEHVSSADGVQRAVVATEIHVTLEDVAFGLADAKVQAAVGLVSGQGILLADAGIGGRRSAAGQSSDQLSATHAADIAVSNNRRGAVLAVLRSCDNSI